MKYEEHKEQVALIDWFEYQYPMFKSLLVHVPNGQDVGPKTGARLKRAGLRKGFPDLILAIATKRYPGLFIEMKSKTGYATKEQKEMLFMLENQGYKTAICKGWLEAKEVIDDYLDGYKGAKDGM